MIWKRVLIDLSTQKVYLDPTGAMRVANREQVLPAIRRMLAWARSAHLPVISSIEARRPNELCNGTHHVCVEGSEGQKKLRFTLLSPRILIEADNSFTLPWDILQRYRQVIFRKRARNFLTNPKADRLLTELDTEQFVLFGVGLERSIKTLALGLRARHKQVMVVVDACGFWSQADGDLAVLQMAAKGVNITRVAEIVAEPADVPRRRSVRRDRRQRDPSPERRPCSSSHAGSRRRLIRRGSPP